MEYEEAAAIINFRRQLEFPRLKWLDKAKFEEYLRENWPIYPYMISSDTENNNNSNNSTTIYLEDNDDDVAVDRRLFVGRSIDTHTSEGALYGFDHYTDTHMRLNLELVGTVSCTRQARFPHRQSTHDYDNRNTTNRDQSWKLTICSYSKVYEIYDNFLVLCLDSESLFEWKNCALFRPLGDQTYPHPVGACVERTSDELAYVGRVANRHRRTPDHFGQVCLRDTQFTGVVDGAEYVSHEYDVLCLRPSPSSLKMHCRELIRTLCGRSNEKIEALGADLPRRLVEFVKYASYVATGDCLLRGEKLVSYDQSFEMEIRQSAGVVYRPLWSGHELMRAARPIYDKIKKFKCCYYNYFEDTSVNRDDKFTYPVTQSFWLLANKIVLHSSDGKCRVIFNFSHENQPQQPFQKYILTFDCFTMIENFLNNTNSNVLRRRRLKAC